MTIRELLDVIDPNREGTHEKIRFLDGNGITTAEVTTGSEILDHIEELEVEAISAEDENVFGVWLKKGGEHG